MTDYMPPLCTKCCKVITGIIGTTTLICTDCNTKFELREVNNERL